MQINKLIRTSVGADLSRNRRLIGPRWVNHYPDETVNLQNMTTV